MKTFYEMTAALKAATDRAEAAEAQVWELETENKTRFLCIIRSIRSHKSKAWNARTMNWVLVRDFFAHGSSRAWALCVKIGIDPEGYTALAKLDEGERDLHGTV